MKKQILLKLTSLILLAALLIAFPVYAEEAATNPADDTATDGTTEPETPVVGLGTEIPELLITEISWCTAGLDKHTTSGYTEDVTSETFEFVEILNTTDHEIDLYEYGLVYINAKRSNAKFEYQINEYTPFKPGDFWDGTSIEPNTGEFGDLSNKYVNPDTFLIAPGECIVVWMVSYSNYFAMFNEGKGLSMDDFRFHWDIPENVRCVAFDSNASEDYGGNTQNFSTTNTGVPTYGIVRQSEELNTACNSTKNTYIKKNYWENDMLVSWITTDFYDIMYKRSTVPNTSMTFTWDFKGYAATDKTYIGDEPYVYDTRRGYQLTMYDDPTPGRLSALQKMTLNMELDEGETFKVDKFTMHFPRLDGDIIGIKIDGKLYRHNDVFTAPVAGLYTFDYLLQNDPDLNMTGENAPWERSDAVIPELMITEIGWDTVGLDKHTSGYTSEVTQDAFEFIEICNTSDHEIDLYEYALVYSSSKRDSAKFEFQLTKYTPFKPGDFWDGSKILTDTDWYGDLGNKFVNPETCVLSPGECVMVWLVTYECYDLAYNEGKGLSMDDFRLHWDIPEDVKCIAFDANGESKKGGSTYNFTATNSGVSTFSIVRQSEDFQTACNTSDKSYVKQDYWKNDLIISWASLDFEDQLYMGTMANVTVTYTWDFKGYATKDQTYLAKNNNEEYVYDSRRGYVLSMYDEATPGKLSPIQKMTLNMEVAEGETFLLDESVIYYPWLDDYILGIKVDGYLYKGDETFTAPKTGLYNFDFFFNYDEEPTEAPTEPATDPETDAPTNPETNTPTDPVTDGTTDPVTDAPTAAPTDEPTVPADSNDGGCSSVVFGVALMPVVLCLIPLFFRKKIKE